MHLNPFVYFSNESGINVFLFMNDSNFFGCFGVKQIVITKFSRGNAQIFSLEYIYFLKISTTIKHTIIILKVMCNYINSPKFLKDKATGHHHTEQTIFIQSLIYVRPHSQCLPCTVSFVCQKTLQGKFFNCIDSPPITWQCRTVKMIV